MFYIILIGLILFVLSDKYNASDTISSDGTVHDPDNNFNNFALENKKSIISCFKKYQEIIRQQINYWNYVSTKANQIDESVIAAQIFVESAGNQYATNNGEDSVGLGQLGKKAIEKVIAYENGNRGLSDNFNSIIENIYDPNVNIHYEIGYLIFLMNDKNCNLVDALKLYNTGKTGTQAGTEYVQKILACQHIINGEI
jgi:soluble lytic murein transglycosylase-like protein